MERVLDAKSKYLRPGLDPRIAVHHLTIKSETAPIKQAPRQP